MLFYLVKYPIFLALMVYFRRINYSHRDRIPKSRRIIFVINHPSAFLDALIAGAYLPFSLYFLVRGDVYINRMVRAILHSFHTMPIFRFRDGFNKLRDNQETFDGCYRVLEKANAHLMLAGEGGNSERKRLLPLQKGAARLAFGAFEAKGFRDLAVVPIGVNYTDVQHVRTSAMVSIGEPLLLEDYLESYAADPRKAVHDLTTDLERNMRKVVVQIDRAEDEAWVNPLLDMARDGEGRQRPFSTDPSKLDREFARAGRINAMGPEERNACREEVARYRALLDDSGLRSFHPSLLEKSGWMGFLYVLGLLPFSLGWLLNAPPLLLSDWLVRKKVPSPVFFPSIRFTAGLFAWSGYAFVIAGALGWPILAMASAGVAGWFSLPFFDRFSDWRNAMRAKSLDPVRRQELASAREALLRFLV